MLKLFAVLLGGRARGCNTELHDVVFVVGSTLKETYPILLKKWFGEKQGLHIDAYIELTFIDNHEVVISKEPVKQRKKLFFVNVGGYKPGYFGEMHEVGFFVSESKLEVKERAKQKLGTHLLEKHCDDNLSIDDLITVDMIDQYYISLIPVDHAQELKIMTQYIKL